MKKKITRNQIEKIVRERLGKKLRKEVMEPEPPEIDIEPPENPEPTATTSPLVEPPIEVPTQGAGFVEPEPPVNTPRVPENAGEVAPGKRDSLKLKIAERKRIAAMQQAYVNKIIAEETAMAIQLKTLHESDAKKKEEAGGVASESDEAIESLTNGDDVQEESMRRIVRDTIKRMLSENDNLPYGNPGPEASQLDIAKATAQDMRADPRRALRTAGDYWGGVRDQAMQRARTGIPQIDQRGAPRTDPVRLAGETAEKMMTDPQGALETAGDYWGNKLGIGSDRIQENEDPNTIYVSDKELGQSVPVDVNPFMTGQTGYSIDDVANPVDRQRVQPPGWNNPNPSDEALRHATNSQMAAAAMRQAASQMNPVNQAKRAMGMKENKNSIFAPNHYCVHHGGVYLNGKVHMAEAVSHNYNEKLGKVTHYNMKLADGRILENVPVEKIQITNASLAEYHVGHRDDDKKKPDADGDGVPDWADKKKGDDDEKDLTNENASDKEWYDNQLFESLTAKWTKQEFKLLYGISICDLERSKRRKALFTV